MILQESYKRKLVTSSGFNDDDFYVVVPKDTQDISKAFVAIRYGLQNAVVEVSDQWKITLDCACYSLV